MEKVLVAHDWGESFVALNLVAKPAIDEVLLRQLAVTGRRQGDSLLGLIADSEYRDVQRSRIWSTALSSARQPSLTQLYVECRKKRHGQRNQYDELVACLFADFIARPLPYPFAERVWGLVYTGFLAGAKSSN